MINFGAVPIGAVLPVFFDSFAGSTGASVTISGLAITDIEIFKGTSMTQRASDAGYVLLDTDGIDLDGITGIHGFSIDTGDNTDASFYAAGSFYTVVVSAITVDSQTVNFVAATFRCVAAENTAGTPVADTVRVSGTAQTARDIGGAVPAAAAGASGGLLISGSNSGTTTFGAMTVTGALTVSDGVIITASTTDRAAFSATGNGVGSGMIATGGATGVGFSVVGGSTSGNGINITTTSGHGVNLAPVGTNMHGLLATGGNGGTSDGIKAVAGTGGVPIRGDITGNITGTLSTVTTLTNLPAITANWLTAAGIAADAITDAKVASDVTIASVTGSVGSVTAAVAITSNIKTNQALTGFQFLITDSVNHAPATLAASIVATRSINGGAFAAGTLSAVTEISNGIYSVDFGAGDLNGKTIILRVASTGNDDVFERIVTQA